MAEDARIRKTKEKLSKAFVELLQEQCFCDITPAKICERAGINRSTFYRNYKNTTQLKDEIEKKILDSVEWSAREFDLTYSKKAVLHQLSFLTDRQSEFQALTSGNFRESIFEKVARKLIADALNQYEQHSDKVSRTEYEKTCIFVISGVVGVIFNWFLMGMQQTPEEMADFIVSQLEHAYKDYV